VRHSFEEKLNIVSKVKSGQPINTSLAVRFLIWKASFLSSHNLSAISRTAFESNGQSTKDYWILQWNKPHWFGIYAKCYLQNVLYKEHSFQIKGLVYL